MHELDRCGQLTGTLEQLARVGYCTSDQVVATLDELQSTNTADVTDQNGVFTIKNRRMYREHTERVSARERKRRGRGSAESHDDDVGSHGEVTEKSRSYSSSSYSPLTPKNGGGFGKRKKANSKRAKR